MELVSSLRQVTRGVCTTCNDILQYSGEIVEPKEFGVLLFGGSSDAAYTTQQWAHLSPSLRWPASNTFDLTVFPLALQQAYRT